MTELSEDFTNMELRNQIRAKKIVDLIYQGCDYTQIAKELKLGRNRLYAILRTPEVRELMNLESVAIKTALQELLQELRESPSPQDKRTAAVELGKMQRHLEDKLMPSLSATAYIDVNKAQENEELYKTLNKYDEVLRRLKPYHRDSFWKQWAELYPNELKYTPKEIKRKNLPQEYEAQEALYKVIE